MKPSMALLAVFLVCQGVPGCGDGEPRLAGPGIRVNVAPLTLPGVEDACYGLYVQNGSGDVVAYLSHVCSSQYGNGAGGDIAYVVPCDAQDLPTASNAMNTVTLVLEGIDLAAGAGTSWLDETQYKNPCGWPDPSVGAQALATVGAQQLPLDTNSPAYTGPGADTNVNWDGFACQRVVKCEENADAEVAFNLTVMRDADQGFFDIAVSFEDIFCSAKVDCAYPGPNGGPIELVHDPVSGERVQTVVWAFACTDGDPRGPMAATSTHLYVDDLVLDCGATQYTVPVSAGPGNIYPIAGTPPTLAPAPLVQAMVFEGREEILDGAADADKLYWNVALGLKASYFAVTPGPAPTCVLRTKATASKGPLPGGVTPTNTDYPVVTVDVTINSGSAIVCTQHPLAGTGPNAGVSTGYTGTFPDGSGFATSTFGNEGAPVGGGIVTTSLRDPCTPSPCYPGVSCAVVGMSGYACGACPSGMTGDGEDCACPAGTLVDANGECVSTLVGFAYVPPTGPSGFVMGSPVDDLGPGSGVGGSAAPLPESQHTVILTRGFWMQETEVTQGQWKALSLGVNPSCFQDPSVSTCTTANANDSAPVEMVDWYSAVAYLNARSLAEGLSPCYSLSGCDPTGGWQDGRLEECSGVTLEGGLDCTGYRLPSESEWEYAARAGTAGPYYTWTDTTGHPGRLDLIAWYDPHGGANGTEPVRGLVPNDWGLYDMLGNVEEWVGDWYGVYPEGPVEDPVGPLAGEARLLRGGAWAFTAEYVRAANRSALEPAGKGVRKAFRGFRPVRTIPSNP